MKDKIIILGAGGHAKVLADLIRLGNEYEIEGILDPRLKKGETVLDLPVLGDDRELASLSANGGIHVCIGVGSVGDTVKRKALYREVVDSGASVPVLVHPSTVVSGSAALSDGVQVMAGAVIQAGSTIGENTIINTGAIIDHDCNIGRHVHVCPGAVISGECSIGEGTFIGAGAVIINGIRIGNNATVAAGAVVIHDIPDNAIVMGVPAK